MASAPDGRRVGTDGDVTLTPDISARDPDGWHPLIRQLHDHWRGMAPSAASLPGRKHLDPLEIPNLLPWLWLVDVVRQPALRFRYRLLGSRHQQPMGGDFTGRWMDEVHENFVASRGIRDYEAVAQGETSWRRGAPIFHTDQEFLIIERLMLPLADDGRTVDMIMAITLYFRNDGSLY